jgi:hypothetical protein
MKFDRPIAFLPNLARELGGMEEAIFYQQLYYWSDKGSLPDGWVYKTIAEIEEETTLTRRQQDRVRRKLIEDAWIEVKKTHAPNGAPTLHYRCLVEISIGTKRTNGNVRKGQMETHKRDKSKRTKSTNVPYTESTTEKTAESTAVEVSETDTAQNPEELTPGTYAREFFGGNKIIVLEVANWALERGYAKKIVLEEMLKFKNYWTEPTKNGKKQHWETTPTFEIKRRLLTWLQRTSERSDTRRSGAGVTIA